MLLIDLTVRGRFDLSRTIIQLKDRHSAALCLDEPDIDNESGHPLLTTCIQLPDGTG